MIRLKDFLPLSSVRSEILDREDLPLANVAGEVTSDNDDVVLAAEIARRVNAYDELLSACEAALDLFEGERDNAGEVAREVRAAIAKATTGEAK